MNVDVPPCGCEKPDRGEPPSCYCGVEDLLGVIRRRYSLAVLAAIGALDGARYRDVAARLGHPSSSTLADTLRALEAAHLITRGAGPGHPSYHLSPAGSKLLQRLRPLLEEVQGSTPTGD